MQSALHALRGPRLSWLVASTAIPLALQARLGQQLWPREQPSLAHPMVPSAAAVALFVQTGAPSACWVASVACHASAMPCLAKARCV